MSTVDTEAIWYLPEEEQLHDLTRMPRLLGTLHAAVAYPAKPEEVSAEEFLQTIEAMNMLDSK